MAIEIVVYDDTRAPFVLTEATEVISLQPGIDATLVGAVELRGPQGESAVKGLHGFVAGAPMSSETIVASIAPYDYTISLTNSSVKALVASTTSSVFVIKKNGTQIGTATFAAAGTVATLSFTDTAVTKGDTVTIIAPATVDATLADIIFLLA